MKKRTALYKITFFLKAFLFYFCMFLITIAITFITMEFILRIGGWVTAQSVHTVSKSNYYKIPGMFEPGQTVYVKSKQRLPYRVSIDSLGFRCSSLIPINDEKSFRILCIGDSFTFGDFVDDHETFPYALQQLFQTTTKDTIVINAGVGGTTVVDQYQFLQRCLNLRPDLVILTFSENDLEDLYRIEPMYMSLKKNMKIKSSSWGKPIFSFLRDTCTFNFILKVMSIYDNYKLYGIPVISREHQNEFTNSNAVRVSEGNRLYNSVWITYENYLQKLKHILDSHSISLLFVIFPGVERIDEEPFEHQSPEHRLKRIEKLVIELGIESLNLLPVFQKGGYSKERLYLIPFDKHPSPIAYKIAAHQIFNWLQSHSPKNIIAID